MPFAGMGMLMSKNFIQFTINNNRFHKSEFSGFFVFNNTFLNYNLGATTNQLGSGLPGYGLHYQWGRKDPFPNTGDPGTSATGYYDGNGRQYNHPGYSHGGNTDDLEVCVAHPYRFLAYDTEKRFGWVGSVTLADGSANPANKSWGGHDGGADYTIGTYGSYQSDKTVFDPCPAGYRVPPIAAYDDALTNSENYGSARFNAGYDWITYYNGTTTTDGPGIFPAAGLRNSSTGTFNNAGSVGYYWSSTNNGTTNGYYLSFNGSTVLTRYSNYRSCGFSVRCVSSSF